MDEYKKRQKRLENLLNKQDYNDISLLSSQIDTNIIINQNNIVKGQEYSNELKGSLDKISYVLNNFDNIVDDINREFFKKTKLDKADFKFIIFSATLHSLRWYLLPSKENDLTDKEGEKKAKKLVPEKYKKIIDGKVPYDKVISGMNGQNHRSKTLGHDPILGWIFGVHDILVNTMTTTDSLLMLQTIDATDYQSKICITQSFDEAFTTVIHHKTSLPIAVANQALHLYSDTITKKGIPIPIVNLVNRDLGEFLNKYNYDFLHMSKHFGYSQLIDSIIEILYSLSKDYKNNDEQNFHQVKSKQVIAYGNLASSILNVVYTAKTKDKNRIDFAGYLNTIYKLILSESFKNQIKKEFIKKALNDPTPIE